MNSSNAFELIACKLLNSVHVVAYLIFAYPPSLQPGTPNPTVTMYMVNISTINDGPPSLITIPMPSL